MAWYLNAERALKLDQELFSIGFNEVQLMELAGLAVAQATHDYIATHPQLKI